MVGTGSLCPTAMALATFLLFLSSVSAQTIYDIVSRRFTSTSLKCRSSQTLVVRYNSGKRLGTATCCLQGLYFFVLYSIIVLLSVSWQTSTLTNQLWAARANWRSRYRCRWRCGISTNGLPCLCSSIRMITGTSQDGFGAALSDSSAKVLNELKVCRPLEIGSRLNDNY